MENLISTNLNMFNKVFASQSFSKTQLWNKQIISANFIYLYLYIFLWGSWNQIGIFLRRCVLTDATASETSCERNNFFAVLWLVSFDHYFALIGWKSFGVSSDRHSNLSEVVSFSSLLIKDYKRKDIKLLGYYSRNNQFLKKTSSTF